MTSDCSFKSRIKDLQHLTTRLWLTDCLDLQLYAGMNEAQKAILWLLASQRFETKGGTALEQAGDDCRQERLQTKDFRSLYSHSNRDYCRKDGMHKLVASVYKAVTGS